MSDQRKHYAELASKLKLYQDKIDELENLYNEIIEFSERNDICAMVKIPDSGFGYCDNIANKNNSKFKFIELELPEKHMIDENWQPSRIKCGW